MVITAAVESTRRARKGEGAHFLYYIPPPPQ